MKHSEKTINTIKSMAEKGHSSRVIAELVLGSEKKKSTVNSILSRVVEETDEVDNSRILFISDLHVPYHHPQAFEFLKHLKKKYNPTRIICLGDECD